MPFSLPRWQGRVYRGTHPEGLAVSEVIEVEAEDEYEAGERILHAFDGPQGGRYALAIEFEKLSNEFHRVDRPGCWVRLWWVERPGEDYDFTLQQVRIEYECSLHRHTYKHMRK